MKRALPKGLLVLTFAIPLLLISSEVASAFPAHSGLQQTGNRSGPTSFTLDNVPVTVQTPFLSGLTFTVSSPGNGVQEALASEPDPQRAIAVIAVPFGTVPATESDQNNPLPPAQAGGADAYRAKLKEYRTADGGNPQPGPKATFFGQVIQSDASLLQLALVSPTKVPTLYVEWVVEAGPRLWIVRITEELHDGTTDLSGQGGFLASLQSLTLTSDALGNPSTLQPAIGSSTTPTAVTPGVPNTGGGASWNLGLPALLLIVVGCLVLVGDSWWRKMRRRV